MLETLGRGGFDVTKKSLIEMLAHLNDDCKVIIFNGDSQRLEYITGCIYGPTVSNPNQQVVELTSDEL